MKLRLYAISDIDIERTKAGWRISASSAGGETDKSGMPWLERYFRQYSVEYPESVFLRLEWLWDAVERGDLTETGLEREIDRISKWIMQIQIGAPRGDVWDGCWPDITEWVAEKDK